VSNGSGKSESKIEETVVEEDLKVSRWALEEQNVDRLLNQPRMDNGTLLSVQNHLEAIKSHLYKLEMNISQSQQLKLTLLPVQEMDAIH